MSPRPLQTQATLSTAQRLLKQMGFSSSRDSESQPSATAASAPIDRDGYVAEYAKILDQHGPGMNRIQALRSLEERYVLSQLTPESRATMTELYRLSSDPRYIQSGRLQAFKKQNASDVEIAMAEVRRVQIPSPGRVA